MTSFTVYVGRCPVCAAGRAAVVQETEHDDVSRQVGRMMLDGLVISKSQEPVLVGPHVLGCTAAPVSTGLQIIACRSEDIRMETGPEGPEVQQPA